ncbi:MAG: DUF305 domain-containing protein [Devosia sp.]
MRTQIILIATAAFLTLSGTAIAQGDPHHPAGTDAPVATESPAPAAIESPAPVAAPNQATTSCPAMMPMMQSMQAMQMMRSMQSLQMEMMRRGAMGESQSGMPAMKAMPGTASAGPDVALARELIASHQSTMAMAKAGLGDGTNETLRALIEGIVATQEAEIAKLQGWLGL